jgi:hypothetical protein
VIEQRPNKQSTPVSQVQIKGYRLNQAEFPADAKIKEEVSHGRLVLKAIVGSTVNKYPLTQPTTLQLPLNTTDRQNDY